MCTKENAIKSPAAIFKSVAARMIHWHWDCLMPWPPCQLTALKFRRLSRSSWRLLGLQEGWGSSLRGGQQLGSLAACPGGGASATV
jgi:hypothetical protein